MYIHGSQEKRWDSANLRDVNKTASFSTNKELFIEKIIHSNAIHSQAQPFKGTNQFCIRSWLLMFNLLTWLFYIQNCLSSTPNLLILPQQKQFDNVPFKIQKTCCFFLVLVYQSNMKYMFCTWHNFWYFNCIFPQFHMSELSWFNRQTLQTW